MPQQENDLKYPGGLTRLYIDTPMAAGLSLTLQEPQSHYLTHVLRAKAEDGLRVFNGTQGEWRATIHTIAKRSVTIVLKDQTRPQAGVPDLWLLLAPVKKTPLDFIVQKATELGVARLRPVITRRTIVERVNLDRMRANAIEAAEQSERLCVPLVDEPMSLGKAIAEWDPSRRLMFCDEGHDVHPPAQVLAGVKASSWAILTGPEGGFDPVEREMLRSRKFVTPVSLGPRIMRADTAALAAITVWQSTLGDWG